MRTGFLKISRIVISMAFLVFTGFLFLDFSGTLSSSLINGITWIQFVPSLIKFINLAGFLTLGFLVVMAVTLLYGRVYCSTVCPLGILQDVVSRISKWVTILVRKKKVRYRPSSPHNLLRYSLLGITTLFFLSGSVLLLNLLDPFSLFGKIFSGLVRPLFFGLNNTLAGILQSFDIYSVYYVETRRSTFLPLIFPAVMLGLIVWFSFTRGRLYCNTVCPVGSFLGLLSKASMYRIKIDDRLCNHCADCSLICKAECIDLKNNEVDFSRCVGCFNCIDVCSKNGIDYQNCWFPEKKQTAGPSGPFFTDGKTSRNVSGHKSEPGQEAGPVHKSEPGKEAGPGHQSRPGHKTGPGYKSKPGYQPGPGHKTGTVEQQKTGNISVINPPYSQKTGSDNKSDSSKTGRRNFLFHLIVFFAGYSAASRIVKGNAVQGDIRDDLDVEVTKPSTIPEIKNFPVSPPGSMGLQHFNDSCTACQLCVSACPTRVLQPSFLEYGFTGMMKPRMDFHASYCDFDCVICTEICPTGAILPLALEEKHITQTGLVQLELDNCVVQTENTACGACAEHCPTQAVRMVPYQDGLTIPEIHQDHCVGCGACEYICPTRPYRAIYVDGNVSHAEAVPPVFEELDYEAPEEDFPF